MKPKLAPWLFALLTFTQCTHAEPVDEPRAHDGAAPPPVTTAAAALSKDDVPDPAVRIPIDGLPAFGDSKALVTVVVFTDFECPYCAKGSTRFEELKQDYGDKLRIVVASNPLPMHDHSVPAARAFFAAVEQGKGEAMYAKLFALTTASTVLDDAALTKAAQDIGLDVGAFDRARNGPSTAAAQKTADALSLKLGVRGTPTFYINGRRIVGARPLEVFRSILDDEMVRASALKSNDVYKTLLGTLPEAPPPTVELAQDSSKTWEVDIAGAPSRGPASAPTTVVIFADYECPYCVRAEKIIKDFEAQKGGQVRVIYKNMPLPFHTHARLAAKASLAAERQNKFWEYHDVLVQHRKELERASLVQYAVDLGLNQARFEADLDDPATEARLQKDVDQAAALGVTGTPASFVNGHKITGAQPVGYWIDVAALPATAR